MPRGKKVGGRDFVKGKPGGPGRPKLIPETAELPRLDRENYNRLLNKHLQMDIHQLRVVISDPKEIVLCKMIASIIAKCLTLGDHVRLEALLARAIGTVKTETDLNINGTLAHQFFPGANMQQIKHAAQRMIQNSRESTTITIDSKQSETSD